MVSATIRVIDAAESDFLVLRASAELEGLRTILFMPLRREDQLLGFIAAGRREVRTFSEKEIGLLESFAAQAAIAIENARLLNETREALERQTATASILNVISHSVADTQPVFDEILSSIAGPFDAEERCILLIGHDDLLHIGAYQGPGAERARALFPRPIEGTATEAAIREHRLIQYPDVFNGPDVPPGLRDYARGFGKNYSLIVAPMLREDRAIGAILINSAAMRVFSRKERALLETFADQAVIAIENARLFNEVQAKTRDLSDALMYQTGSANILKVIASSPTDVGPVLQAIAESACELCEAVDASVFLRNGNHLTFSGHHGPLLIPDDRMPINRGWVAGRAFLDQKPVHVEDLLSDAGEFPEGRQLAEKHGHRTTLGVPLLRENEGIGAIVVRRMEVRPFTVEQIELIRTFADQAVIAIGNVQLFEQVQERTTELATSLAELRAAQDRLVQTEKLASLGQLTAGIAHEIKNPLNFVNNFSALSAELVGEINDVLAKVSLDTIARGELDEITQMLKSNLEKVVQHGKRADSIVKNMLLHSREGSGEHRLVDINAIVDESLNLAHHGARAEKAGFSIAFQRDLDPSAGMADVYPQEITRVLLNLISNGFYATTKRKAEVGDGFEPVLSAKTKNLGDKVEIRIRDNGTGIPDEVKEKIFNPFFTTKPAGEGTGLGLSMSHDIIVKQHGGSIHVDTEPGLFTEFKIVLPRTGQR
jgi:two-component system NtrC family sensor kinase